MNDQRLAEQHMRTNQDILLRQIRLLHKQIPLASAMHFLLASFIAVVMTQVIPGALVLIGWVWLIVLLMVKYFLYSSFDESADYAAIQIDRRYYLLCIDAFLTGLSWSIGIILLAELTPIEFQIFVYIIVVALCATAIGLAIKTGIYYIYQAALLLPVLVFLFSKQESLDSLLAIFLCILVVIMWVFANQTSRAITDTLKLNLENKVLTSGLKHANSRLQMANEELTQLSSTDGLTLVANRRYFEERLANELARATRDGIPVSLVMLDVDFFKMYNDILGHLSGDECLKNVANCVRESLKRPTDIVARFGGEEFIVMLSNTEQAGAQKLAEEIRRNIEALQIIHPNSKSSKYVTVSVGVSTIPKGQQVSRDMLLMKVDEALYLAKAEGRNTVRTVQYEYEKGTIGDFANKNRA